MTYLVSTREACDAYAAVAAKALGLPRRGVHVGRGRHVNLDGPERHGWTLQWDVPRQHPKLENWAVAVLPSKDAPDAAAKDKQALDAAESAAVELDETWTVDPVAGKT